MKTLLTKLSTFFTSNILAFKIGIMYSATLSVVEKYIFADWQYLIFLMVLIGIDTGLGFILAIRKKNISIDKARRLLHKFVIYFSVLCVTHILANFTVNGKPQALFGTWFTTTVYASLLAMEGLSIFRNLSIFKPGMIPPWITKRLKEFTDTGELKRDQEESYPSRYDAYENEGSKQERKIIFD